MLVEQALGPHVAGDGGHLGEMVPRPQDGVAPLPLPGGDVDGVIPVGVEGAEQRPDVSAGHERHVAETDQRAVDVAQGGEADPERPGQTARVVGVVGEADRLPGQRRAHRLGLVAGHHHHRSDPGAEHLADHPRHDRHPVEREQKLVLPHPLRAARGQDHAAAGLDGCRRDRVGGG